MNTSTCPGCGLVLPDTDATPPANRGASAACFDRYGELLARCYSLEAYRPVHQIVVDAYAAQHPGGTTRRDVQTVALCLMTLCLFIEDGLDPRDGPALHKQMMANRPDFCWLEPPKRHHLTTVIDVLAADTAAEHTTLVWAWGADVWRAWTPHHSTIRAWNAQALQDRRHP
jgi:Family of unknown function (DUF5946)